VAASLFPVKAGRVQKAWRNHDVVEQFPLIFVNDRAFAIGVRVVLEEHVRAAFMFGEERIGVEVAGWRIHDRERIV